MACVARCCPESAVIDSTENPPLASEDETPGVSSRKFFHCQNSRLRVRASAVRAGFRMPCDFGRMTIADIANNENHCGTSVSCNLAKMISISFADFLHPHANAFASLRSTCAPGFRRQYFLKPEDVFFSVLVYSGCSAFRFPSARSD
jgi:hypothetical protein